MNPLEYIVVNIVETLLRVFPIPYKTGLVRIGRPERDSPVFLTGNYHLTVQRVKHALRGVDAYLLVANSRGINVWCAATGGHFTSHDVISALKTSGIEDLVAHRTVILPQLAATGVESNVIAKRTGWKLIWGPVYAKDIPAFVKNRLTKTREMREVEFPWAQRVEMAVAWAFPISLITALIIAPLWREAILPLVGVVWGLSLFIFLAFPLYSRYLSPGGKRKGFVFFDFGRGGFQLILWVVVTVGLIAYSILIGNYPAGFIVRWGFMLLVIVLLLSLDLMGSTPVFKSGLHEDRLLQVTLDENRCKGADFCEQVCPRNCYELESNKHIVTLARADRCVQCGACIVQCPFDALFFKGPKGEIIPPETVRRFKLNLIGKRVVKMK
jgi:NAD-dependent dihydropyrimidine dehydrogenase PreA subunit